MDTSLFKLPVNMIRQYCFCPRIVYYHQVIGLKVTYPGWVHYGEEYQKKQQIRDKRRTLSKFKPLTERAVFTHNVMLEHAAYPFYGICDGLIEDEHEIIPIEFKSFASKINLGQKLQLTAYGLLAELIFEKQCTRGYIVTGEKGKPKLVTINEKSKYKLLEICDKIKKIIETESLPYSTANGLQCIQCEFLNHCNDRF
ncbi:CRISPR-associated protein Cas4 [Legionella sp. km535]|uniref:CRISPR-associated protein Cas4 n=1 Tax=Legionella sp. km535 TaxID=2498107 RepID=UPI0013151F02|nr:CRISPR-associated protein Cas4 [Legionella sp. km535]